MNKNIGRYATGLSSLIYSLLICLALVGLTSLQSAMAQTPSGVDLPAFISPTAPKQFQAQRTAYLRHALKPLLADVMPTLANPAEKEPLTGYARVADDQPAPGTASIVTSTEQTVDLSLGTYPQLGIGLSSTTGLPSGPTPSNVDVIWSDDETYLVFASNISGFYHLYVISSGGEPITYSGNDIPIYVEQLTGLSGTPTANSDQRYPSLLGPSDNSIAYCSDDNTNQRYQLVVAPFNVTGSGYSINEGVAVQVASGYQVRHPFYTSGFIYFSGNPNAAIDPWNIYSVTTDGNDVVSELTGPTTGGPVGLDNDNPTFSTTNNLIAWDSTAAVYTPESSAPPLIATSVSAHRNIYTAQTSGTSAEAITVGGSYNNDQPKWSTGNTNLVAPAGSVLLFFDSNRPATYPNAGGDGYKIYYFSAWFENTVFPEDTAGNPAIQVNTSDTKDVGAAHSANTYDDTEPAVSSLVAPYISVAYISNRYLISTISDNPLALSSLHDPATVTTAESDNTAPDTKLDTEPASYPTVASTPVQGTDIFVSRLLDVDPPSLITYNSSTQEIVHEYQGDVSGYSASTAAVTHFVQAGDDATFVVRLSDRQTGIGQAWLQIKDPESAYQDSTGLEHKVFTRERTHDFHDAADESTTLYTDTIGGYNGISNGVLNRIILGNQREYAGPSVYQGMATKITATGSTTSYNPGTVSIYVLSIADLVAGDSVILNYGFADSEVVTITSLNQATATAPPSINITPTSNIHFIGEDVGVFNGAAEISAAVNPPGTTATFGIPVSSVNNAGITQFVAGDVIGIFPNTSAGNLSTPLETAEVTSVPNNNTINVDKAILNNPDNIIELSGIAGQYPKQTYYIAVLGVAKFDPSGQEVDCEAIDTSPPANGGSPLQDQISAYPGNFYIPEWTPGVDDLFPFPGPPTDTSGLTYWLPLTPLPTADQDGNGGVLYAATWNTPLDESDYYIDVIAEDASNSQNWRIYDNVWGFTTLPFSANNNILIVNDYALPQKFFARGGTNGAGNGPDHIYGTESYWTDITVDNATYQNDYAIPYSLQSASDQAADPITELPSIAQEYNTTVGGGYGLARQAKLVYGEIPKEDSADPDSTNPYIPGYANGLGINSYYDGLFSNVSAVHISGNTYFVPESQKYDIWRILSRGPVSPTVLSSYGAKIVQQQPNPTATPYNPALVSTVVSPHCVIWLTPYSGDVYAGPGTITDGNTQANLETFLNAGGRLHIEGKDIGYALTGNGGFTDAFYNQYLCGYPANYTKQAFITDDVGGGFTMTGGSQQADLISNDAYINNQVPIVFRYTDIEHNYFGPAANIYGYAPAQPFAENLNVSHSPYFAGDLSNRQDGSLDCYSGQPYSYMDGFTIPSTTNDELTDSATGTAAREVFYQNKITDSIVSYSSFGMATISQETQDMINYPAPLNGNAGRVGDNFYTYNQRSNLIHNIVCALRTAQITGKLTSTGTAGGVVAKAVVWATPFPGVSFTNPNNIYASAVTNPDGSFIIQGLPAGRYNLSAYKEGYSFQHGASNGDVTVHGGDSATFNVGITPEGPGNLQVTIVDINNNPISGVVVTPAEIQGNTTVVGQTTPSNGIVTFTNIPSGVYDVNTLFYGYTVDATPNATVNQGTTTNITITLTPSPVTILGTVYVQGSSPQTGIPGATLTLTTSSGTDIVPTTGGTSITTTSGAGGAFTFNLTAGEIPASVVPYVDGTAAGYLGSNPVVPIGAIVLAQDYTGILVPLVQVTSLAVTAVDALTQLPVPGLVINATGPQSLGPATTSSTGAVSFLSVSPGTYTVTPGASSLLSLGYISYTPDPATATVNANSLGTVSLTLQPGLGSISGTVSDAQSTLGLSGATVSISNGTFTFHTTTSSTGAYSFTNIRLGTYTASTSDGIQYIPSTTSGIVVTNANTTLQNIPLTPIVSTISGTVSSADGGTPINGAVVSITDGTTTDHATTNSSGFYSIPNAETGTYTATVTDVDYTTGTRSNIVVVLGVNQTQNFTLTPLPLAPTPTFSPAAGAYVDAQPVTLSDSLTGSTIYYTTDGTAPTTSSSVYTAGSPIVVATTETITAAAIASGYGFSPPAAATYTIGQTVPTPTITPNGGIITVATLVTLADSQTGVSIYYTTDGSTPSPGTGTTSLYSAPFTVASSETVSAIAVQTGYISSAVATATFTGDVPVIAPVISPNGGTFVGSTSVTISSPQSLASIYYTLDGSTPTITSALYVSPIAVSQTETIKAIAYVPGSAASTPASATFVIVPQSTAPVITPDGGTFSSAQLVTITDSTSNAAIFYTVDGSTPTSASTPYTSPLTVASDETIKAIAVVNGFGASQVTTAVFTVGSSPVTSLGTGLQLFSLPYSYPGVSLDTVLGYTGVKLAVWKPASLAYAVTPNAPANQIVLGQGYWVRAPNTVSVTLAGIPAPTNAPFVIALQAGWNMIGDPFTSSVSVSNLKFAGETQTFAQATGSGSPLIGSTLYDYDTGSNSYEAASTLSPEVGYWIYAYSSTDLDVPPPGG
jgi:hypothetical protein